MKDNDFMGHTDSPTKHMLKFIIYVVFTFILPVAQSLIYSNLCECAL